MPFDEDPTAGALFVSGRDPDGSGLRALFPMAWHPDVTLVNPAPMAGMPDPFALRAGRRRNRFHDRRRRRGADDDLGVHIGMCGIRQHERGQKQRKTGEFFHEFLQKDRRTICFAHQGIFMTDRKGQ